MRCGCPQCGAFMIHAETSLDCVCPDCLYRCHACQGTGTAIDREAALHLKDIFSISKEYEDEPAEQKAGREE